MVSEITTKVQNLERDISVKQKIEKEDDGKVIVVSTYDADESIVEALKESEENFKRTQSFRNQRGPLFKYVKKVGPSIRSHINSLKKQALGIKKGGAEKCGSRRCKTCKMLIETPHTLVNGTKVKLSQGSCKTYNICYLAKCKICDKSCTRRTMDPLHKRINGHRQHYKEILNEADEKNTLEDIDTNKDKYMLGLHLHLDHGYTDPDAFDRHVKFGILEIVNPTDLERKEYCWMHQLNTFQPSGINTEYPFGIPLLGQK